MNTSTVTRPANPISMLRRLTRRPAEGESCEFCSLPLAPEHRHLLEVASHKIVCACNACALRFDNVIGRWKLIPRDSRRLVGFELTDAHWNGLGLPIELAFIFHSTPAGRVMAMYPSPGGATESSVALSNWATLVADNPVLAGMEPDVQALLFNRLNGSREYYLAPLDVCFELVGLIRMHWRGFSGGDKVWEELSGFFSRLRENSAAAEARPLVESTRA